MNNAPPYYQQVYPFSCVPACLRMVLASAGCNEPESRLRELSKCDETGTTPSNAVAAARSLGFADSYIGQLSLTELREELVAGSFPIVYLNFPMGDAHAVVVTCIDDSGVGVLDPADPDNIVIETASFETMWRSMNNRTIVVAK